jgi:hypothetical protein
MENYKILQNINDNYHVNFNKTCENISIDNFRENPLMKSIVQNCSFESGIQQYNFISENYSDILHKLDYGLIKKFDSIGGNNCKLINGLTPKVYSYIREAILFYKFYLEPKNITEINNLLIIGGGYGLEFCIIYSVCSILGIKINNISGIDMSNVAKLQNKYFEIVGMDNIFKSYSSEEYNLNTDYVYSNCCLAELTCKINNEYYTNYCLPSKGFYIVWGQWAAEIPEYYKPFVIKGRHNELINDGLVNKNTNCIIVK